MTEEISSQSNRAQTSLRRSILLRDYMLGMELTDKLPKDELHPVLLGLFGEVGSVMATAKKPHREQDSYVGYRHALIEEFGDVLWYFATLCRRLNCGIDDVFSRATAGEGYSGIVAASDLTDGPISHIYTANELPPFDETLLGLGTASAALLSIDSPDKLDPALLQVFATQYLLAVQTAKISFAEIVHTNTHKVRGRFLQPDFDSLPTFDDAFSNEEQLPRHFEISISERKSGQSYLQWNGVFVGDPLTDNITDRDGYRFHDVFHFSYAAILHWSPTFRSLIKQKRKSDPIYDEAQDGGRAIVVEEGLTAWIFSRAKDMNFFEDQKNLSFDLLKIVQQFVRGYEVEACPLKLWEYAILEGYKVFRQVRKNGGGIIVGDRDARTIIYKCNVED